MNSESRSTQFRLTSIDSIAPLKALLVKSCNGVFHARSLSPAPLRIPRHIMKGFSSLSSDHLTTEYMPTYLRIATCSMQPNLIPILFQPSSRSLPSRAGLQDEPLFQTREMFVLSCQGYQCSLDQIELRGIAYGGESIRSPLRMLCFASDLQHSIILHVGARR